jgi:hypothetical protein
LVSHKKNLPLETGLKKVVKNKLKEESDGQTAPKNTQLTP